MSRAGFFHDSSSKSISGLGRGRSSRCAGAIRVEQTKLRVHVGSRFSANEAGCLTENVAKQLTGTWFCRKPASVVGTSRTDAMGWYAARSALNTRLALKSALPGVRRRADGTPFTNHQASKASEPKPPFIAKRHPARATAGAARGTHAFRRQRAKRRWLAQQRAKRETARAGLRAQRSEEHLEPRADAVHRPGFTPLAGERTGTGCVMAQCAHDVAARWTRCLKGSAGQTGAQESVHGFKGRQRVRRRDVLQKSAPSMPAEWTREPKTGR